MDRASYLDEHDPGFTDRLRASHPYVQVVAAWLASKGYDGIDVPEQKVRETAAERWKFVDGGDILVTMRVEVKHRPGLHFDSVDSFPFSTVIVDEVYKVDGRNNHNLLGYATVNADATGLIFVPGKSRKHWKQRTVLDTKKGESRTNYECPKGLCCYFPIPEWCREYLNEDTTG